MYSPVFKYCLYITLVAIVINVSCTQSIREQRHRRGVNGNEKLSEFLKQKYDLYPEYLLPEVITGFKNGYDAKDTILPQRATRGFDIESICRKGIAFGSWLNDYCKPKRFFPG
ncbi:hypothetical protein ACF0H5_015744 [Mactra antiquata]